VDIAKLHEWLKKAGYPFELSVGRVLQFAGWSIEHARFYVDPVTSKTREIDIVAKKSLGAPETRTAASVSFVVECKRTRDKPWVVFSSEETGARLLSADFASGRLAYSAMLSASIGHPPLATFEASGRVGHSVVRAFADSKETDPSGAHSAIQAAITAAAALNAEYEALALSQAPRFSFVHVFIPLVVIDGDLFEFYMDESNTDTIVEVERATVVTKSPAIGQNLQALTIVTAKGLHSFLGQAGMDAEALVTRILSVAPDVLARTVES
jgi:hypothetical protein